MKMSSELRVRVVTGSRVRSRNHSRGRTDDAAAAPRGHSGVRAFDDAESSWVMGWVVRISPGTAASAGAAPVACTPPTSIDAVSMTLLRRGLARFVWWLLILLIRLVSGFLLIRGGGSGRRPLPPSVVMRIVGRCGKGEVVRPVGGRGRA
ncbi:hypothetical protein [Streptomyces sp. NPDC048825]|uniref:hypothetical protein n=1 Tax=Streptomyces sp. NPDC048825 TaxID=3365592 RepID=UPI0037153FF1